GRSVPLLPDRRRGGAGVPRARGRLLHRLPGHQAALPGPHVARAARPPRDPGGPASAAGRAAVRDGPAHRRRRGGGARRGGVVRGHEQPGEPERPAPPRPRGAEEPEGRPARVLLAEAVVRGGRPRGGGRGLPPGRPRL
ncbi:MAG: Zinc-binding protein of the histidine triad (HIT) family, partial [uncultured Acidimicrobiales bacterium]